MVRQGFHTSLRPAGSCHCGAVEVDLDLTCPPDELTVRACQCDFCGHRGARTASDKGGVATIRTDRPESLLRYRFGFRTADYLLCAACGTYVAAVQQDDSPIAVVNVGGLGVPEFEGREPVPVDHAGETLDARAVRRRSYWMPVSIAFSAVPRVAGAAFASPDTLPFSDKPPAPEA